MSLKTITAVVVAGHNDVLEQAIAAARHWSAHLDVICLTAMQLELPMIVSGDAPVATSAVLETARPELEKAEARVSERLGREDFGWSVDARIRWVSEASGSIAAACRYADMVVLPAPAGDPTLQGLFERTLYNTRVPLLLVPSGAEIAFETVMIAWDESDVALFAVRSALPLLRDARSAEIVTVDDAQRVEGENVALMLERHGVKAPLNVLPRSGRRIHDALLTRATELGADVIVMGAYGHRRLREILLGGVTRAMIERSPLPLLLAR